MKIFYFLRKRLEWRIKKTEARKCVKNDLHNKNFNLKEPSKTFFGPKRFQLYIKKIIIINDDE